MNLFRVLIALLAISLTITSAKSDDIAQSLKNSLGILNALYFNRTADCKFIDPITASQINCSGVIIHGKEFDEEHAWIPNQSNPRKAVSFSYLRYDIPTNQLYEPSGFIYNQFRNNTSVKLDYYCIYPFDAFSSMPTYHPASSHGCGFPDVQNGNVEHQQKDGSFASCPSVSIKTSDEFINKYVPGPVSVPFVPEACSFDANEYERFKASVEVQIKKASPYWNELITSIWTEEEAASIPITAFFYMSDGKGRDDALGFQKDYCNMYKKFIPVVILDFTQRVPSQSLAFTGKEEEQQSCN
ncbi:hypothetical protein [Brucella intermedia]|uniref:hypothetical protein n=1 Tax=Brucella intermedia TaxID=94625 RepID=UPI00124BFEFD|nr:hypothetical protein [Brucella intermedia]KAB2733435.1 hypothetical protein F9L02_00175 [Brucella intermedia]